MKAKKLLPIGTRVRLINSGSYIWSVSSMQGHKLKNVFGIIAEYKEKGGERQGLNLYSRKTGEQLSLAFGEQCFWYFARSEFVREKEPKI